MKFVILAMMSLWVVACSAHDENYYRMHPNVLHNEIKKCPDEQPQSLSCEQLTAVAAQMNELAYQLRSNPQLFGQQIMTLQTMLVAQEKSLQQNREQPELTVEINKNRQILNERLAVVKWLESPES
jgi:hypothetical protein